MLQNLLVLKLEPELPVRATPCVATRSCYTLACMHVTCVLHALHARKARIMNVEAATSSRHATSTSCSRKTAQLFACCVNVNLSAVLENLPRMARSCSHSSAVFRTGALPPRVLTQSVRPRTHRQSLVRAVSAAQSDLFFVTNNVFKV